MTEQEPQNINTNCTCDTDRNIFLPCSGGSNCGQIANQIAIRLTEQGLGKMYCLAGIGAHIENMINTVNSAVKIISIDGCNVSCSLKLLEHLNIKVDHWICVNNLGIDKNHDFNLKENDISLAENYTKNIMGA